MINLKKNRTKTSNNEQSTENKKILREGQAYKMELNSDEKPGSWNLEIVIQYLEVFEVKDIIYFNKDTSGSVDKGEFYQITNEAVTTLNSEAGSKSIKRLHQNKPSSPSMNSKSDKKRIFFV
ncbi:hypothetical protein WA026_022722 [Henosepilachna vigintioctopunctata]|uniref:Uncharacterized protein n=1 Tax=Henosepilachna vigintioctopunctata TaxID=420089 RepID=A0AAW1UGC6_9CUCU